MNADNRKLLSRVFARCEFHPAPYGLKKPCRVWQGAKCKKGYGRIGVGGRKGKDKQVHRVVSEITDGPTELFVCHKCDRPSCCEPSHLFKGTNSENIRDCVRKGRWRRGPGKGVRRLLNGKWQPFISKGSDRMYLGAFDTEEEALEVRREAEQIVRGDAQ